uniref:Protein kinase domain-containing protein n=1 Tax=Pyrodinium bahamense TaxID=73915 RepID=A0A7S0BBN9_9DINO
MTNFSRALMLKEGRSDPGEAQGPPTQREADAYTAPEVVQGAPAGPDADVFSFGTVALYTLTAEEPPAEPGAAAARAAALAGEDPAPLGSLAIGRPVVAACLATEPSQRPDLSAVYQDLLPAAS